ncbi:MAG: type II secretion system F family protein [Bacteriovoracaceae bacterium]|nr:type II secretion system F family protein [Bacteriovoracaceae bacterium]
MNFIFLHVLGKMGIVIVIGILIFFLANRYSQQIFDWIEKQTFGTRDYILKKADFLFWEVKSDHVTYALLGMSFGLSFITFVFISIFVNFLLAIFASLFILVLGWKAPRPIIDFFVERRIDKFQVQMVDALNLLANGLRAGLSLPQACGMVVEELPQPISQEFNFLLQQNRLGVPLDECFQSLYQRVPTEDNQMFVTCISILRETGGNLAETFDTITGVIRERVRLKQKIATFIAQGKIQGTVIGCVPVVMLFVIGSSDPTIITNLFTKTLGIIALVIAFGLNLLGVYLMMWVVKIKV